MGREEKLPFGAHLARNLVIGAADTARSHLEQRRRVLERFVENFDRVFFGFFFNLRHRAVEDFFGDAFLAASHQIVDKAFNINAAVFAVGLVFVFLNPFLLIVFEISSWFSFSWRRIWSVAGSDPRPKCREFPARCDSERPANLSHGRPNHYDGVLLKVMSFAWDISRDLHAVREPDPGHFPESRVRLLRRGRKDLQANPRLKGEEEFTGRFFR